MAKCACPLFISGEAASELTVSRETSRESSPASSSPHPAPIAWRGIEGGSNKREGLIKCVSVLRHERCMESRTGTLLEQGKALIIYRGRCHRGEYLVDILPQSVSQSETESGKKRGRET